MPFFKSKLLNILLFCISSIFIIACSNDSNEDSTPETAIAKEVSDSWWQARHKAILEADKSNVELLFLGDSITQNWESAKFGLSVWSQHYGSDFAFNMGFSSDKTQNLLWRIENGALDGMSPSVAVLMIGTNNVFDDSAEDIAEGIKVVIDSILLRLPNTKLIVHRIFPRGLSTEPKRVILDKASELVASQINNPSVIYLDINSVFDNENGDIPIEIMPDGLHPSTLGYQIWAEALSDYVF